MFMKLRIIVLLTIIGLSGYGSTYISLPRHSEEGSVRFSPKNNYEGEFVGRSIPFPFDLFGHFRNKQLVKTQVAKLNKDVAALNRKVEQLMQSQRRADESIQALKANEFNVAALKFQVEQLMQSQRHMTRQFRDLAIVNGSSSSNHKGKCPHAAAESGGKVIGIFCYIVSAVSLNFSRAQNACNELTGDLAQPLPILGPNQRLYTALKGVFPTEFEEIENVENDNPKRLWIGYMQETADADKGVLTGQKSGRLSVEIDSSIFDEVEETTAQEGAAITETGFWTIFPITTRLPYICRFPLI